MQIPLKWAIVGSSTQKNKKIENLAVGITCITNIKCQKKPKSANFTKI